MSGLKQRLITLSTSVLPTEVDGKPIACIPVSVLTAIRHLIIITLVMYCGWKIAQGIYNYQSTRTKDSYHTAW